MEYKATRDGQRARDLLSSAEDSARRRKEAGKLFVFALDYECAPWFDPSLTTAFRNRGKGTLQLWVIEQEKESGKLPESASGFCDWQALWNEERYRKAFNRVRELLRNGEVYQVNLSFQWRAKWYGSPVNLYQRLAALQPVPFGAYLERPDGSAIVCRSPELFFARSGLRVVCRPMKGTAPPSVTGEWIDEKVQAENVMIVDLIRNDLSRLHPKKGVFVPELLVQEHYATVTQVTSSIVAEGVEGSLWEVLRALFPCGSVTGAPKRRAMEVISELESEPRGVYCGVIGVIYPGGDVTAAVPIRTVVLGKDRGAFLATGSGIVWDSTASEEWRECWLKSDFARLLRPEVGLVETMRVGRKEVFPALLAFHRRRLSESVKRLGFSFGEETFWERVKEKIPKESQRKKVRRARGVVQSQGEITITVEEEDPPVIPVRCALKPDAVVDASDPLQQFKTTRREHYDRLLQVAKKKGFFDLLVLNQLGEVVEGCRSTLFVCFRGDRSLYTPPLESGCLAGVLRSSLLQKGVARERILFIEDLRRAEAIYLGNAVHGLLPAVLVCER